MNWRRQSPLAEKRSDRLEFLAQSGPTFSSKTGPRRLTEMPRLPAAAFGYLLAFAAFLAFIDSRKR
jgi:hypothetical protein